MTDITYCTAHARHEDSLGHWLLCAVRLYELCRESPGCCCTGATLKRHHSYVMWGYVMATLWLCYSYVMAAALAAASARGETVCQERLSCASQERLNVSTFPTASQVFFQPTSLHLAYPGFSKQCEQQDNWYHEQDQLYNWHSWQDTQQVGEWGSSLREREKKKQNNPSDVLQCTWKFWSGLLWNLNWTWDTASFVVTSWRDSHPSFERDTLSSSVRSSLKRAGKMAE